MFRWACGASMLVPSVDCASLLGDCCCVSHHRVVVWQWLLPPVLYGINHIWMWKWAWCLIIKTSCQSDRLYYEHFVKLQNFILGADILVDIEILVDILRADILGRTITWLASLVPMGKLISLHSDCLASNTTSCHKQLRTILSQEYPQTEPGFMHDSRTPTRSLLRLWALDVSSKNHSLTSKYNATSSGWIAVS